jgi:hypothetical protein
VRSEQPVEAVVSRICSEFGLTPRQAWQELEEDDGLLADVLEFRAYANAYQRVMSAKQSGDLPPEGVDPWVDEVFQVQLRLLRDRSQG